MKGAQAWLAALERSDRLYGVGLVLLFSGLALGVSVAMAMAVTGAVIIVESVLTSYIAGLINSRSGPHAADK